MQDEDEEQPESSQNQQEQQEHKRLNDNGIEFVQEKEEIIIDEVAGIINNSTKTRKQDQPSESGFTNRMFKVMSYKRKTNSESTLDLDLHPELD